jgi:hypothetical protein
MLPRVLAVMMIVARRRPERCFLFRAVSRRGRRGGRSRHTGICRPAGRGRRRWRAAATAGGICRRKTRWTDFCSFRNQNPANYGGSIQPLVWLTDGTTNLFALSGPTLPGVSGVDWTFSSIPLDLGFAGWSTSPYGLVSPAPGVVNTVLSNVTQVGILGDWVSGFYGKQPPQYDFGHDITGLDEVRLYSSEIPEPGTAGLLLLGLAAAAGWRRAGRKA